MGKLKEQRVAIAKRIMEVQDPRTLDAISKYLDGRAHLAFTEEEIEGFEAIREAHEAGDEQSVQWSVLRKKLAMEFRVRP